MKKILLLLILLLTTSCAFLEPSNYRECSYDDEDGLYYDYWEKYPERVPCKALNKKIERNRKRMERAAKLRFCCSFLSF